MNLLPITLNEEQLADVKRMAALGYRAADMAAALELDHEQAAAFLQEAAQPLSPVGQAIREGLTVSRSAPEVKLHEAAESGDVDAIEALAKVQRRHMFENLINETDDDEFPY